jgi:NitT/TauT family transport system substrate-binding protein
MPNAIIDVLAMRADAFDGHHARAIGHLIKNHFRALDHLMCNPQDAAYRMATRLNLPASGVLAAYKGLILPDAANNYRLLSGDNPELIPAARKLSDVMARNGLLKQPDSLLNLIRADFLPTDELLK